MINNFKKHKTYLVRDGKARLNTEVYSNKKLCFVATNKDFLMKLLFELSELEDCFFVKLKDEPRDGMYLGRCFLTNDELVGEYWAKYKLHPEVMCNVQDDEFTTLFRDKVKGY